MNKAILALAYLLIATSAIHLNHEEDDDEHVLIVNIKGSNGKYLSSSDSFDQDIGEYSISASVSESDPTKPQAQWIVEQQEGGKYALKSIATGDYLAVCNGCWHGVSNQKWDDSAYVNVADPKQSDDALWTPTQLDNGKWTLQGNNGQYLNVCHGCIEGSHFEDYAFVQVDNPKDESLGGIAEWEITQVEKEQ